MATSSGTPIESLPEELLVHILTYLDSTPPSEAKLREEPSLQLTVSAHQILKALSLVSKRWRRMVLPLSFKHTRLRLDQPPREHWRDCKTCGREALSEFLNGGSPIAKDDGSDLYHSQMVNEGLGFFGPQAPTGLDSSASANGGNNRADVIEAWATWLPRFYHTLKDFLNFITQHDLASKVESFVLITDQMLVQKLDRFPHQAAEAGKDPRYRAAAAFWQALLSVLDPSRIAVLAPPNDLACLTNCAIDTFGDWAFGDMDFHVLDLRLDPKDRTASPLLRTTHDLGLDGVDSIPHRYPGIAKSSILNLRPWHQVSINEGCFLKAYGTYEYFERGPPSLVYSIKDCLTPRPTYGANVQRLTNAPLASLRKLTYVGIFPFANHLDFRELLPQLEELDLQLAPLLGSNILDDPARTGKAELEDCWSELVSIYQNLASQLATFRISERNVPRLKTVICQDMKRRALQDELDEVFIPLCMPVWAECSPGIFMRLRMSADTAYGVDATTDW